MVDDGVPRVMVSHLDGRDARALQKFAPVRAEEPCIAPAEGPVRGPVEGLAWLHAPLMTAAQDNRAGAPPPTGCAHCFACRALRGGGPLATSTRVVLQMRGEKRAPLVPGGRPTITVRACLRTWSLACGLSLVASDRDDLSTLTGRVHRNGVPCEPGARAIRQE